MNFLRLDTTDPHLNLAIEEYIFNNLEEDIFILWRNSPSVIIGKNQNAFVELNTQYVKDNNIKVARRITGGGAVYHDLGNINFSYISKSENKNGIDFLPFVTPIIAFFKKLGAECTLDGRNDLLIDGKKISGNAQRSDNGKTLHHGTLLYDADASVMNKALNYDREKYQYKAVKSHTSRVGNIKELLDLKYSAEEFMSLLENTLMDSLNATRFNISTNQQIDELYKRNSSNEWIFQSKSFLTDYSIKKSKRFPFGNVCIDIKLNSEIISEVSIYGDFFELKPIEKLEDELVGLKLQHLASVPIGDYINNMSYADFIDLLK